MRENGHVKIGSARKVAATWVSRHASLEEGFGGAFFSGTTRLSDGVELSPTSDLNVLVVRGRHEAPADLGRFVYHGVLLNVGYVSWARLLLPGSVLASYELAACFRTDRIIVDPTGHLRRLQEHVAQRFAERSWVQRRCQDVRAELERGLRTVDPLTPVPQQVTALFAGMILSAQLILVPALRHPPSWRNYVVARKVLARFDQAEAYPELLETMGCVHLGARRVQLHLQALAKTFDATVAASRSPYFLGTPITPVARSIVIDGSQELIDNGYHREAMLVIVAAFAQCHTALTADASRHDRRELMPAFESALSDLNLDSVDDMQQRVANLLRYVPVLWGISEKILVANPAVH